MRHDPPGKLLLGLATGVAFGALLQRGQASSYDLIMKQLQLRDGSVAKIMATATAVGAVGAHALIRRGAAKLDVKPLQLGGIVGGGILFGTGLAMLGYCPGTSLAAAGEGKRDAVAGVLGMMAGAALFVRVYPKIKSMIEAGDYGKVTLARPGGNPWPWVGGFGAAVATALLVDGARARWSLAR